ncbi:M23 family metallopeptidase [Streptomyces sp. AV19]|uniref:M23 family metallopeptidase n=1 Tax=Streptomyces sp. AV19 TaxID=2793068 RepID=UPI001F344A2B|nr:M23 family metallopeptidase [Streptomyces sp. AV19]MDG4536872.1 peptidoglycan DD-metalloendopeptidase family protein [Streptomyces sp. AV19]
MVEDRKPPVPKQSVPVPVDQYITGQWNTGSIGKGPLAAPRQPDDIKALQSGEAQTKTEAASGRDVAQYGPRESTSKREARTDAGAAEPLSPDDPAALPGTTKRKAILSRFAGRSRRRNKRLVIAVSCAVLGIAGISTAAAMSGGKKAVPKPPAAATSSVAPQSPAADSGPDVSPQPTPNSSTASAAPANSTQNTNSSASGKGGSQTKYALPVPRPGLSARFNQAGGRWAHRHTGIDFPVGHGENVIAATGGTVTTKYNRAYGNMIIVTSPDGIVTWYCHLSKYEVRSGTVRAGQVIGYVGATGNVTGAHLHFEVRVGGKLVDPEKWLRSHGISPT